MADFSLYEQLQMQFTANTHGWAPVLFLILLFLIAALADDVLHRSGR